MKHFSVEREKFP